MPWKLFEDLDDIIIPKEVLKNHTRFKLDLNILKTGGKKSIHQKDTIRNITTFFDLREKIIDFCRDLFFFLLSEAKYKVKYGEGLKILTPKQMLQRLPIALTQVTAVNNSENLLNEISQIGYSLHKSKEITKNVYNNIIKSI